jgi:hypothetical protein
MQETQRLLGKQNYNTAQIKCDRTNRKDHGEDSRQFQHLDAY